MADGSAGSREFIATCAGGLEEALAMEISARAWKAESQTSGSVRFTAPPDAISEANLVLRTASRILVPVTAGPVSSYDHLYRLASRVNWPDLAPPERSIRVTALSSDKQISDTRFAGLRVKDAVVDRQNKALGRRSNVDRRGADISIVTHIHAGRAEISLDTTGKPLHLRGYRTESGAAPLRETVAAGMILLSGWDAGTPLLDPFCGSGTILIEAALIAAGIPPSIHRDDFLFLRWPGAKRAEFESKRAELRGGAERQPGQTTEDIAIHISGSDSDPEIIEVARRNADRAGVSDLITFTRADFFSTSFSGGVVVCNPPYGERLELQDASDFYRRVGDHLKQNYGKSAVHILSANRQAMKSLGLRPSRKTPLWNGGLDSRLYRVEIY